MLSSSVIPLFYVMAGISNFNEFKSRMRIGIYIAGRRGEVGYTIMGTLLKFVCNTSICADLRSHEIVSTALLSEGCGSESWLGGNFLRNFPLPEWQAWLRDFLSLRNTKYSIICAFCTINNLQG